MFGSRVYAGPVLLALGLALLAGCARHSAAKIPTPPKIGATETGIASWYGVPYDGRPSASGEIYDMRQLTAAHRTFPFGTWVEVTDLDNGKKVEVRVNDRGPFVNGRIIDLSLAAAQKIEMLAPGTARVRLKVIASPPPNQESSAPGYAVQAGAFSNEDSADRRAESLREKFAEVRVVPSGSLWRVLVGREMSLDRANHLVKKVRAAAGEGMVVGDR